MDAVFVLAGVGAGVGVLLGVALQFYAMRSRAAVEVSSLREIQKALDSSIQSIPSTTALVDVRREEFINQGPKTFFYLDDSRVDEMYLQLFGQLQPTGVKKAKTGSADAKLGAELPFVHGDMSSGESSTETVTYDVRAKPSVKYHEVELHLLMNDQVILGIEDLDVDDPSIDRLKQMCDEMKEEVGFQVPEEARSKFIEGKRHSAGRRKLEEMKAASGYVLMRGHFSVVDIYDGHRLIYSHPVESAAITADLSESQWSPPQLSLTATLFGKVTDWEEDKMELRLMPIALY